MNIARNAIFNFAGGVLPAVVSLATIPMIVGGLGDSGYGLFILVTAIVGYFALIDINITAGSVKFISGYAARNDKRGINQTFSFGLIIYITIGLTGALAIFIGAPALVHEVFEIPADLVDLGEYSLRIAAFGFLFGQMQTYFQSVPQALLRYDVTSRIEMAFGTAVPIVTVGILAVGFGLAEVILFRVAASIVNCVILWISIRRLLPDLLLARPERDIIRGLLEFSAYSFLSRIAAITYAYADKLIIGAVIGMKELAYYAVATTLANRVLGLTFRLSSVLFPSASALGAKGEIKRLQALYLKATRYVVFINGSILILVVAFAEPILYYWMSPEFARYGALILMVVAIAQFIDSLTNIPSLVNDGLGHPRVSGSFAIARAFIGLIAVYVFVRMQGIEGAAWAHLLSSILMTTIFIVFVHGRTVPCALVDLLKRSYALPMTIILVVAGLTGFLADAMGIQFLALAATMALASVLLLSLGIGLVLLPEDRIKLLARIRNLFSSGI